MASGSRSFSLDIYPFLGSPIMLSNVMILDYLFWAKSRNIFDAKKPFFFRLKQFIVETGLWDHFVISNKYGICRKDFTLFKEYMVRKIKEKSLHTRVLGILCFTGTPFYYR